MEQIFSLLPFSPTQALSNLHVKGKIARHNNKLAIAYQVSDNLERVAIASRSQTPMRKHELWQETCFEFFLGIKNTPQYWEFNLSPTGDWNVYRFEDYRQGMVEESAFDILPLDIQPQSQGLVLSLEINLDQIVSRERAIEMAIATVIKEKNGNISYWTLTHRGKEADFHRRDSFMLEL